MSKLLKNKIIIGALLSSCALNASAVVGDVEGSVLRGLRGAMDSVQLPVETARERASDLYAHMVQNGAGAQALTAYVNLLADGHNNQYVQTLGICTNYFVKLKFASADRFDSTAISGTATIPLPEMLWDKEIYYVPVYDVNDYRVTTWECVTNVTMGAVFQGDSTEGTQMQPLAATATAVRSIIAKYTKDPVTEKCLYSAGGVGSVWAQIITAAGTCDA